MSERQSLGEQKEGFCAYVPCGARFRKKRIDQKFCSPICLSRYKYKGTAWKDRPEHMRQELNRRRNERYRAKREEELEKQRVWRQAHPEEARAKDRAKYLRNKEKHVARTNAYRAKHPEIRKKEYENSRNKRPWLGPFRGARKRAGQRALAFNLTREWCEKTWTGVCALSKLPFQFGTTNHYPFSPSIDRIDNNKGYTQDNCRFICYAVNSLKGSGTDDDLRVFIAALTANQN